MTEKLDVVVGDTLQWFTSGSLENLPLAAIVTLINHNGMLNMLVITDSGFPQHKVGVWPIGHPILKENPNLAVKSGAWDFRRPKVAAVATVSSPAIAVAPVPVVESQPAAPAAVPAPESPPAPEPVVESPPFEGGTTKPTLSKKDAAKASA